MPHFSRQSLDKLLTCDKRLQAVFLEVIKLVDCTILCGHRGRDAQNAAVAAGNSRAPWPTSKHNSSPSMAVDVAPFPIDWNDAKRFDDLAVIVQQEADKQGIPIRWGGTFKHLVDRPHFELITEQP